MTTQPSRRLVAVLIVLTVLATLLVAGPVRPAGAAPGGNPPGPTPEPGTIAPDAPLQLDPQGVEGPPLLLMSSNPKPGSTQLSTPGPMDFPFWSITNDGTDLRVGLEDWAGLGNSILPGIGDSEFEIATTANRTVVATWEKGATGDRPLVLILHHGPLDGTTWPFGTLYLSGVSSNQTIKGIAAAAAGDRVVVSWTDGFTIWWRVLDPGAATLGPTHTLPGFVNAAPPALAAVDDDTVIMAFGGRAQNNTLPDVWSIELDVATETAGSPHRLTVNATDPTFQFQGRVDLAPTAQGVAMAYTVSSERLRVQALDPDGSANGSPRYVPALTGAYNQPHLSTVDGNRLLVGTGRAGGGYLAYVDLDASGRPYGATEIGLPGAAGVISVKALEIDEGLVVTRYSIENNQRMTQMTVYGGMPTFPSGPTPQPQPQPEPPVEPQPQTPAEPEPGYWMVRADGAIHEFGAAPAFGALGVGTDEVVDSVSTPSGNGLWTVDSSGRVHASGDAVHHGDATSLPADDRPVSIARTSTGLGYWVFSARGRALAFGDASFHGDVSGLALNGPIVDAAATTDGQGYWLLGSDGGVFALGSATFHGSTGSMRLNAPAVGLVPDPDGEGYWFVASDGGVFAFDADFRGSMGGTPLNEPVVGMTAYGDGYVMVASDGGAFVFSTTPFLGSLGAVALPSPVVTLTPR